MYQMHDETKTSLNNLFSQNMGMNLDDFIQLSFDEQASLLESQRQKHSPKGMVKMHFGSGETAMTLNVQRGKKVVISDGTIIKAGTTPEHARLRVNSHIDEIIAFPKFARFHQKKLGKRH